MNIKSTTSVYPSYKAIQREIQEKYIQKYQSKINSLKNHLSNLQAKYHFQRDHQHIQNSIITLSAQNPHCNNGEKDKIKLHHAKKSSCLSSYHGESLNYYIEDDGEEESNYETYLKFKKKALERDLEEEEMSRVGLNNQERRKQKEDEEHLFKKLYVNPQDKQGSKRKGDSLKKYVSKSRSSGFNLRQTKENVGAFLMQLDKGKGRLKKRNRQKLLKTGQQIQKQPGIEAEKEAFEKNRKFLTENYRDILKKLEGTNIVKWRMLNTENGHCC